MPMASDLAKAILAKVAESGDRMIVIQSPGFQPIDPDDIETAEFQCADETYVFKDDEVPEDASPLEGDDRVYVITTANLTRA